MSLHIGNLSSRTRPDELERVFRRFGRCTIQIKDKYGFVVYDYPASAERALKTLKGNRICGEALNLSWSKQQPTAAPKRLSIGGKKLYDPPRRGYTVRDNPNRYVDNKKLDGDVRKRLGSSVFVSDSNSNQPFDLNHSMTMSDSKDLLQDDLNVQCVGNGTGFDRYEPRNEGNKEMDGHHKDSPQAHSSSVEAEKMFEKKAQCEKEMSASRKRQRSADSGDSSKKANKRDYSEGEKGLSPSSFNYDYAPSRSQSSSETIMSLFESLSPSKSKSVALEKVSGSSSRRSSPSCHSGTKSFDSRSKSHNSSLLPLENGTKDYVGNDVSVVCSNDLKISGNITSAVENGLETRPAKLGLEEDTEKDISKTDDEDFVGGHILAVDVKSQNITSAVENELETRPAKLGQDEDAEKDILKTDGKDFAGEHVSAADSDVTVRSKISSEEMCMVLKHYGLQCPDEKEMDLTVETFLGSARLWPWELVYYRRLKKGAILAENYSRRIAQNQEFGIVDKYVRGSSGWGELS